MDIWKEYIKDIFNNKTRSENPNSYDVKDYLSISTAVVTKALNFFKNGKSPDPDNIQSEFFKLTAEKDIEWLTEIFNKIYSLEEILRVWQKSTFVTR